MSKEAPLGEKQLKELGARIDAKIERIKTGQIRIKPTVFTGDISTMPQGEEELAEFLKIFLGDEQIPEPVLPPDYHQQIERAQKKYKEKTEKRLNAKPKRGRPPKSSYGPKRATH